MATLNYQWPGIGGSLGACAVCGESFVAEILLGTNISTINITGIEPELPVHTHCGDACMKVVAEGGDWRKLPEGPLRKAFAETEAPRGETAEGVA